MSIEADSDHIRECSRTAARIAGELHSARDGWVRVTDQPPAGFAPDNVASAFRSLQDAWFDEVGLYIEVLVQGAGRLQAVADGYDAVDHLSALPIRMGP